MTLELAFVKAVALLACSGCVFASVMGCVWSPETSLHRTYFRYVANLEQRLRLMFLEPRATQIVIGQAAGCALAAVAALMIGKALPLLLIPLIGVAPLAWLERRRKQRVQIIEAKLDGFVLSLANGLRASPSPGRALAMIQPTTAAPLDREIELVLREMRVGSTLEQALGNLSARVRSFQLDAALSGLLIGRQTGGNISEILDSAAQTMREMARLHGVLRSKTAEGRAQTNVLAAFPAVLIFGFDLASPGYFRPLTESFIGVLIMLIAIALWLGSILIARRIMAVQL